MLALLSCLAAFVLSVALARIYVWTYQGLSWSRSLVQSFVLGSIVSSLLMLAIGDNLARGIGIVGSLAIIRFRTNLRDPRDMVFVFAALGIGVACGVHAFSIALMGTLVFSLAALSLRWVEFGGRRQHDGLLRFQLPTDDPNTTALMAVLHAHSAHVALVTMRSIAQGDFVEYAYQVRFQHSQRAEDLLAALSHIDTVRSLSYVHQTATVEA